MELLAPTTNQPTKLKNYWNELRKDNPNVPNYWAEERIFIDRYVRVQGIISINHDGIKLREELFTSRRQRVNIMNKWRKQIKNLPNTYKYYFQIQIINL